MLDFGIFGSFFVRGCDGRDITPKSQKAQALLAMVLVSDSGKRTRAWLVDHLWSESPKALAYASLRQAVREIRRYFGKQNCEFLDISKISISVDLNCIRYSHDRFPQIGPCGDFLEGIDVCDPEFEDWLTVQRSLFSNRQVTEVACVTETRDQTSRPSIGLRIDRPVLVGDGPVDDRTVNMVIDRIASNLIEEGYYQIFDRRTVQSQSIVRQRAEISYSLCLRCFIYTSGERVNIKLALVDLLGEQTIWLRQCYCTFSALRREDDPEILKLVAICVERVWLEKDRLTRQLQGGEDRSDLLLSAIQDIFELGVSDLDRAEQDLRSIIRSTHGSLASAWLAFLMTFRIGQRYVSHSDPLREEIRYLIENALQKSPDNSVVLALAGHVHSYVFGNYVRAMELFESAIRVNPSRALAWDLYSVAHAYMGLPVAGLKCAQFARVLGAHSMYRYYFDTSCLITASMSGRHDIAIRHGEDVLEERPDFNSGLRYLTASYAHLGQKTKAFETREKLYAVEPQFCTSALREAQYPGLDTQYGRYFLKGLKKAGVRELPA